MNIKEIIIPKTKSEAEKSESKFSVKEVHIESKAFKPTEIDEKLKLAQESNQHYDDIVEKIVGVSKDHLTDQNCRKTEMRKVFVIFFVVLLSFQIVALITLLALSAITVIPFEITDNILATFITSVFVETLGAIIIMITFAFGSKEEVKVIELLIAVVKNYQKFNINNNSESEDEKKEATDNK